MLQESSHNSVVGKDVRAAEVEEEALGVMGVFVGGEAEDFGERESVGGGREVGMSENLGVDLIENSHVGTFFDQ